MSIYSENGIQFGVGDGEVTYRKRIVQAICKLVPPVTQFDVSHVEGKERICNFFQLEGGSCNRFILLISRIPYNQ